MRRLLVVSSFFLILVTSTKSVFAQQTIPKGTQIALVTDLNRWATVCKDCQTLKYSSINLTVTSNTDASRRKPNKESIYTVEYQDGKIRLRTYAGTYLSVCGDCRKKGPNGLLVATMKKKSNGKVPRESLFEFIPVKNSDFYMIKAFNGRYVTRYHPGNDRPDMLKGKSQVLAAYYHKTDRRAGKFNVIALNKNFSKGFVAGKKIPRAVKHPSILRNQWMTNTTSINYGIAYRRKNQVNQKAYIPEMPCSQNICRVYTTGNTGSINDRSGDIFFDYIYKIEYLGATKGYRITGNGQRVLSPIRFFKTKPYFDNVLGQLAVFEKYTGSSLGDQFWNIEKVTDDFYILQNRASGLYLGNVWNGKVNFYQDALVNKKDALPIAFERYNSSQGLPKTHKNGYTFNTIDVPNSNEMVINPMKLTSQTWRKNAEAIGGNNYSFSGYNDWQLATKKKAEEITKKFQNTLCENYLDLFALSPIFYSVDPSWDANTNFDGILSINRKGVSRYPTTRNSSTNGKVLLWRKK